MTTVATLSAPKRASVVVGTGFPVRVMALVGANHRRGIAGQIEKVNALSALPSPPTIVADLSLYGGYEVLEEIVLRGFIASTLPIYGVAREGHRVDRNALLERAIAQVSKGASMLTIHPTPTRELVQRARSRLVPWTSRGGGLIIEDLLQGDSHSNAYVDILPELAVHAREKGVTLSIGAAFRSANIFDSLDEVQTEEITLQIELARQLSDLGVSVIIESPGHARPRDIRNVAARLASAGFPVMPLGPIPTDTAIGQDHVAAAIGATLMGLSGAAHILAAVTERNTPAIFHR